MLKNLLLLISITLSFGVFSQETEPTTHSNEIEKCGQSEALERMRIEDPKRYQIYQQSRIDLEKETDIYAPKSGTVYTVPVVFHVLHNNGPENISDAQIHDALFILNRDFRKLNADVNSVYHTFLPIASDAEIEFEFATIAPNGTCFNGITRTVSAQTSNGQNGDEQFITIIDGNDVYQGVWPHHKYLNIYVCEDLGGAAGYTFLPNGSASENEQDMFYNSIFMRSDYIGSIGTSYEITSRALTHEVGHWLNLSHIWGSGGIGVSCGDDFVADTPPTKGFSPCPSSPNDAKICDPSVVENYENYMDYSYCSKMFTQGQSARMRSTIEDVVGGRNNIWTATNLQEVGATGVPIQLCSAQINANTTAICVGSSVSFSLSGVNEPITSYSWSFPGGTPATSTQPSPTVTYNTSGTYDVILSITTASASRVITNTSFIHVDGSTAVLPLPIFEGFVSSSFPPTGWTIDNGGNTTTWVRSQHGTVPTAGNSATLNFDPGPNTDGDIDDLNTPSFSLIGQPNASISFDVAYRKYSFVYSDKLEVLISPGCGMPFQVVFSKEGSALQTEPDGVGYSNPTVWRTENIDLSQFAGSSEVKVKFRGISGWGNQIYLDNINITGEPANFTASENSICEGSLITYTSTAIGATSWDWNFGVDASPATASGEGPHTVEYLSAGSKTVSLSVNGGAASYLSVMVNSAGNVSLSPFPTLCANHSPFTLTQGSPSGGTYSGDGVVGNQFDPSIAGIGMHSITYLYSTPITNCLSYTSMDIFVEGCAGLYEENTNSFNLFPNPTTGALTISSSVTINEVVVLDNAGRVVKTIQPENAKSVHMDLSHLSSGMYVVQTRMGSSTQMSKVIVE